MPRVLAPGRAVIAAALAVSCAVLIRPAAAQHGGPSPEPEPPPQEQAGPPAPPPLRPVSFEDLPGWPSDSPKIRKERPGRGHFPNIFLMASDLLEPSS